MLVRAPRARHLRRRSPSTRRIVTLGRLDRGRASASSGSCSGPLVIWATATYTFTDRRLITRSGVIVRRGHDMPLARISDIAYEFGPIDRLLGCGTLVISDASTHGQIKLHDIPRVEETQRQVNELLQKIHGPAAGHEGI